MVDPTKGIVQTPSVTSTEKPQAPARSHKKEETDATDKKRRAEEISQKKAISASEAEETSRNVRKTLEETDHTLGLGQSFDEKV